MIIKNNTNNIVEISYYDRFGASMKQHMCLRPHGTHEISPRDGIVLSPIELKEYMNKGILSVVGRNPVELLPPQEETPEEPVVVQDEIPEQHEHPPVENPNPDESIDGDTEVAPESTESSFVCEICGKEFGSSRGLNKHMKSHAS